MVENHKLNFKDTFPAVFLKHDVMKSFSKLQKMGPYQLIISDPPSMQGSSFLLRRDYPKLIKKLAPLLSDDGKLILCCNDPMVSVSDLKNWLEYENSPLLFETLLPLSVGFYEKDISFGLKALVIIKR